VSQRHPNEVATAPTPPRGGDDLPAIERRERYRQAVGLIDQWMAEEDGYDREMWPLVKEELKDLRTRCRE
jgi:hypothetical protein